MGKRDTLELVVLAAIWGASFLFMRVAAPVLGPIPLMALRVGVAALCLLPVLALRGGAGQLRGRLVHIVVVGAINSAVPFSLLAFATLSVTAGLASILNATSPLWAGLVAHLWLKDRLNPGRVLGLAIGFAGVALLFWGRASFKPGGAGLAVVAALAATLSYGVAASYTKRFLSGVDPLAAAAGSQAAATLLLLPPALLLWPSAPVPASVWGSVAALGVVCTAVAYVLFFRLIAAVGPARTIAVTFLIPPFALAWAALFLGEPVTPRTIAGAAVVLAGTALATGLVKLPARRPVPAPGA
ncbi:MAG TPA: DMT family transporter [Anaeromyxobacteraceae bacterium]|nr:DMT family transporter [Anaeromyxobacteraceae bacterium]